jgi:hypothetical protein
MKPIHKITNIPDLLEDMDNNYFTRPIYEIVSGCVYVSSYLFNNIIKLIGY